MHAHFYTHTALNKKKLCRLQLLAQTSHVSPVSWRAAAPLSWSCRHPNRQAMSTDTAAAAAWKELKNNDTWKYCQYSSTCVLTQPVFCLNPANGSAFNSVLITRMSTWLWRGKKKKKDNLNKLHGNHPLLIFLHRLKLLRICNCLCLITLAGWISIWPSAVGLREPIKDISVVQESVEEQTPGAAPIITTLSDRF